MFIIYNEIYFKLCYIWTDDMRAALADCIISTFLKGLVYQ